MWRRHEIENYLLEPRVVLVALDSFRRTVSAPWVQQLPTDEQDVATLLADLAQPMLEDHAGRVLHWELRVVKGNAGSTDLRLPTPAPAPGSEYPGRDEWLQALLAEVARLQRDCLTVAHLAVLGANEIQARYDAILSDLQRPELIGSGDFLADMDGHQLLSALGRHLWRLGAINLSDEDLQDELVAALARVYQPGLYQPDEFAELATRLCA
jgi:CheY-like chemotaxis protein